MEFKLPNFRNTFIKNQDEGTNTDLGFGDKLNETGQRLINKDGSFNVVKTGMAAWTPYQDLVEMSWGKFFLIILIFYVFVNSVFALGFVIIGIDAISGVHDGGFSLDFAHAFFFSIQTFTTVGYGAMSPVGFAANVFASLDALVGLMAFALATGLFFARFAKPKAMLAFSNKAIIAPYYDITSFQFRIANRRDNKIINLKATVTMSWLEKTEEGKKVRRFAPLELEREKVMLLPLNWTIVHPITEDNPLYKKTAADLREMEVEFLILLEGYDESYAQVVYCSSSYSSQEINWGVKFAQMYYFQPEKNHTVLELGCIDKVFAVEE